jgi:transposase
MMEATGDHWRIYYYLLEAEGLNVQLVSPSHARQLAGRPKTGQLDAQWIARLAGMGLLRPSFVPPPEIRALRDLTRGRLQMARDRTREWQRPEKLPEGRLIKLSSAVHSLARTQTARAILEAIASGERDPCALAALAMGRADRAAIEKSLDGMQAGDHHPALIRGFLDHAAFPGRRIAAIEDMIRDHPDRIEASWGIAADGTRTPGPGPDAAVLPAVGRLAEIPGVSPGPARAIIAGVRLDMSRFPTAARLAPRAGLAPVSRQSGPRTRKPAKGHGDHWLKGYCTQAALGASRTDTFPGERYRRLARRIGAVRAQCAVGRSILTIIWHLLNNPDARFTDLGADWHARKADRDRKTRRHLKELKALGYHVTITEAA